MESHGNSRDISHSKRLESAELWRNASEAILQTVGVALLLARELRRRKAIPNLWDIQQLAREREGCYDQIPHASYDPQEFDDKINMNLFKDVPLLCCYKRIKKGNEK